VTFGWWLPRCWPVTFRRGAPHASIRSWPCVTNNERFIRRSEPCATLSRLTGHAQTARRCRACSAGDFTRGGSSRQAHFHRSGDWPRIRAGRPADGHLQRAQSAQVVQTPNATIEGVALVNGVEFKNGTIDVDLAGLPAAAATRALAGSSASHFGRRHTPKASSASTFDRPTTGRRSAAAQSFDPVRLTTAVPLAEASS